MNISKRTAWELLMLDSEVEALEGNGSYKDAIDALLRENPELERMFTEYGAALNSNEPSTRTAFEKRLDEWFEEREDGRFEEREEEKTAGKEMTVEVTVGDLRENLLDDRWDGLDSEKYAKAVDAVLKEREGDTVEELFEDYDGILLEVTERTATM